MKSEYEEGDLVLIKRDGNFTLCRTKTFGQPAVRECPVSELEVPLFSPTTNTYADIYENLEGKMGLVVYIARNRLAQAVGYRVLVEGHEMFCKLTVANKYFRLVENPHHESRRSGKI